MNAITVKITAGLLERLLDLPPEAQITAISAYDPLTRLITIRIDHPGLPRVAEGNAPLRGDLTDFEEIDKEKQ